MSTFNTECNHECMKSITLPFFKLYSKTILLYTNFKIKEILFHKNLGNQKLLKMTFFVEFKKVFQEQQKKPVLRPRQQSLAVKKPLIFYLSMRCDVWV